ncbi:MAG: heme NO-binding domain-containing protein [Bacteroidales bacterium]|jgi:methyl-accepting chemotaxis protein|nr:heme NO-binding domain-containing protein [Bacteroidales bacterium]
MKGSIVKCLSELVQNQYGNAAWEEILQHASELDLLIRPLEDIDDRRVIKIFASTATILNLSQQDVFDKFGDYWVNTYVPRMYRIFYIRAKNAKQYVLSLNTVHAHTTASIPNAQPPQFIFTELNAHTVRVDYVSKKNLIDLFIGLIKGVSTYYNTPIGINKISETRVELIF